MFVYTVSTQIVFKIIRIFRELIFLSYTAIMKPVFTEQTLIHCSFLRFVVISCFTIAEYVFVIIVILILKIYRLSFFAD